MKGLTSFCVLVLILVFTLINSCYSNDSSLDSSCGRNFESQLVDNVIEWIPDVEEELNCKSICLEDAGCLYYTYYDKENEDDPNLCILLSDLLSPIQECEHCITSLPNCNDTSYISCKFSINSDQTLLDSHVFTNIFDAISGIYVSFSPSASLGCQATVVAIGGGGSGGRSEAGCYGGGGSGYVKSDVIDISSKGYQVLVDIRNDYAQYPWIVRKMNGEDILYAWSGETGCRNGGNGYSGGGGYLGGKGGSNGSDGEGSNGGSGSGFDISTISLEHHTLSPGNGCGPSGDYGGGGGGVLVDKAGPGGQAESFGGGGCAYNSPPHYGVQGMVLIETKAKTST